MLVLGRNSGKIFLTCLRLTNLSCICFIVSTNNTTTTYRTKQIESFMKNGRKNEISVQFSCHLHLKCNDKKHFVNTIEKDVQTEHLLKKKMQAVQAQMKSVYR